MTTGSGVNLNFLSIFSQLLLSYISLFTVFFTADVGFFVVVISLIGICFQVDVDIITPLPPPAPMFFVPTHNSFFNISVTELFEISARLKLVSVPLSSLLLHIVQW